MSIFDIAELLLFFASFFAFGFYLYLAGKYKGYLEAVRVYLECSDDEQEKGENL